MAIPSLNIGGGKWATKQDKLLAYKQNIGGRYFAIDGDTSRNSTATFTNQNGLIESVGNNVARVDFKDDVKGNLLLETQSTNLITQSESFVNSYWTKSGASIQGDPSTAGVEEVVNGDFATDTDWSKGGGWTISSGKAIYDGTGGTSSLSQTGVIEVDKFYKLSIDVISNEGSGNNTIFLGGFMLNVSHLEVGTHVFYGQTTNTNVNLNVYGRSGEVFEIDNVSVKEVQGFASPSLDSPTGAFKMVGDISNSRHNLRAGFTTAVTSTYSLFAKMGELRYLQLASINTTSQIVNFDLLDGTVAYLGSSFTDAKITQLVNGWFKLEVTSTNQCNSLYISLISSPTSGWLETWSMLNNTDGLYIYGAQLEALPYATSYIPTNGSAVTRVKDVANNFGDVNTFNSSEGTLFVEMSALDNDLDRRITLSDGTIDNRVSIKWDADSTTIKAFMGLNGLITTAAFNQQDNLKIVLTFKENDFKMYINGVLIGLDTSASVLASIDRIDFSNYNGLNNFYGECKQLQVFKTVLTASEIANL